MQDVQPPVGYSDLLVMLDDGHRYEIHGGELIVVPSPLPVHQIVAGETFTLVNDYRLRSGGLALAAPLDIVSASTTWCSRTSCSSAPDRAISCNRTR